MILAAAAFAFVACEKPGTGDDHCADCGQNPCVCTTESATELHIDVNVQLQHEVNTNYGGTTATIDSEKILAFFEFEDTKAYYEAMGYLSGGGQVENTLSYGVCVKDGDEWVYTFNPSTASNIGHWFTREGEMTTWGSEEAPQYFFTESQQWMWVGDWREDDPVAADENWSYELAWDYTVGMEPGYYDLNVGDKLSAVEFIFEESTGKTCYIHWNIEIVDFIPRNFNILETQTSEMTVEYNNAYIPIPVTGFDYASVASKLGVADPFKECEIYPLAADGTFAKIPSIDNWFGADGNISGWGDNAIFDFKYDSGVAADNFTLFCMPFNPNMVDEEGNATPQTAADKCGTFTASVAFVNASDAAVVLKLTLTIQEPQAWNGEIVKTYDLSYEFAHNNEWFGAEIVLDETEVETLLGVKPTEAKMLGADKLAATDLYFSNEEEVEILNIYFYEGAYIAAPIAVEEGQAARLGTATGTFYLVNEDKGVQVNVTATITAPAAE